MWARMAEPLSLSDQEFPHYALSVFSTDHKTSVAVQRKAFLVSYKKMYEKGISINSIINYFCEKTTQM